MPLVHRATKIAWCFWCLYLYIYCIIMIIVLRSISYRMSCQYARSISIHRRHSNHYPPCLMYYSDVFPSRMQSHVLCLSPRFVCYAASSLLVATTSLVLRINSMDREMPELTSTMAQDTALATVCTCRSWQWITLSFCMLPLSILLSTSVYCIYLYLLFYKSC